MSNGIRARHKRRYKATTDSKHSMPVAPNLLDRNFTPEAPNLVWSGDITDIHTAEGWLHLAVVLKTYQPVFKVSDAELAAINLEPDDFHGEWNYRITPRQAHQRGQVFNQLFPAFFAFWPMTSY